MLSFGAVFVVIGSSTNTHHVSAVGYGGLDGGVCAGADDDGNKLLAHSVFMYGRALRVRADGLCGAV